MASGSENDCNVEFGRKAAAELYNVGEARGVNPERWERIREQDFLEIAEEITGQRCLKHSFVRCPFHTDKTPSFHIYSKDAFCFSCGIAYDAVTLVAKYRDCSRMKALIWLEDFYHLPPIDDIVLESDDDEEVEIQFAQARPDYLRSAAHEVQKHGHLGLAKEYLEYYFRGKQQGSALPLLMVLGPEAVEKIARDNGLE